MQLGWYTQTMKDLTLNKEGGKDRHLRLSPDPHTVAHIYVHTHHMCIHARTCVHECVHTHTYTQT